MTTPESWVRAHHCASRPCCYWLSRLDPLYGRPHQGGLVGHTAAVYALALVAAPRPDSPAGYDDDSDRIPPLNPSSVTGSGGTAARRRARSRTLLASAGADRTLRVWCPRALACLRAVPAFPPAARIDSFRLAAAGPRLYARAWRAAGGDGGGGDPPARCEVRVWDAAALCAGLLFGTSRAGLWCRGRTQRCRRCRNPRAAAACLGCRAGHTRCWPEAGRCGWGRGTL